MFFPLYGSFLFACYNNDMDSGQLDISTIISVGVIAIIGAILFAVGNRKNKSMLRMLGIAFLMGAVLFLFVMSPELREILTAFAALIAVIIAAFSIDESRRIRRDSIERESRDREERMVNEVTEWLRELEDRIFPERSAIRPGLEDMLQRSPKISRETWLQLDDLDMALAQVNSISKGIKEAEYYQKLTSKLNEEFSSSIGAIMNNLKQRSQLVAESAKSPRDYGEIVRKIYEGTLGEEMEKEFSLITELIENDDTPLEGLSLSDRDVIAIRLGRNSSALRKSILDAVDRAIELKAALIRLS